MSDCTRVLCVDDMIDYIELNKYYIESRGENVSVAGVRSVKAAIEYIREQEVDCVVSDYDLSGETGVDLFERVQSVDPDIPFYLFSTHSDIPTTVEGLSEDVVFSKNNIPDVYDELATEIERGVGGHEATA